MNIKIIIVFLLIGSANFAQDKFVLSGKIVEDSSNEILMGVAVTIQRGKYLTGISSNEYGFYSIKLPEGTYDIKVSYIGFETQSFKIDLTQNIYKNISLIESVEFLDEVVLDDGDSRMKVRKPEMSVAVINSNKIKHTPAVLGEPDVIKSLLLLPGVSNGGETAGGFNVRGGATDQNLALLDEAIIFSTSHLFGFISIFNPYAIQDIKLYKGGIPSRYGGRVSSVLDIRQKNGNSKGHHVEGSIGVLSAKMLAEGPLKKNKGSYLVAGRGSYAHFLLAIGNDENTAYFYDLNTKLNYNINDNNSVYLSAYFGRDVASFANTFGNSYGNAFINGRWSHIFNKNIFSNLSLIYSDYMYGLDINVVGSRWDSNIQNFNVKYDFKHYVSDKIKLYYGLNNIYYTFNPGTIVPSKPTSKITPNILDKKFANEFAVYVGVEQKIFSNLTAEYGLRFSNFNRLGQKLNIYEDDKPVVYETDVKVYRAGNIIGSKVEPKSKSIAQYSNFEPRLALSYAINDSNSIKSSYNRMAQYLQIVTNNSSPTPLDVWTPVGPFLKPIMLDQYAVGYFKRLGDRYALELEGFYKDLKNKVDYIDGANLIANNAIERYALTGVARAYGLEFLLKKETGRFTGWLAYTLSKSEQKITGIGENEIGVNNGNWYNAPYDRLHDISLTGSYELNEKWSFDANFIYQTGRAVTFANSQYNLKGFNIVSYSDRNSNRYPAYHRLDIAARLIPKKNNNRKWKSEWVFSIYNLYNNKNANSISFTRNRITGTNEALKTYIFGIIPSVSYGFKF